MELPVSNLDDDADLPRVGILRNVRIGVRRNDQHSGVTAALVPDLVTAFPPSWQRDDVSAVTTVLC